EMVAGRALCTVVDAAFKSRALKDKILCQEVDEPEPIALMTDCFSSQTIADPNLAYLDVKNGSLIPNSSIENGKTQFVPILRSGSCMDIGNRPYMEDENLCVDDLSEHLSPAFEGTNTECLLW
ncbi:hypothetical protein KI387_020478, partial [Taxus chinensis]